MPPISETGVLRLHGAVQHYAWGGCDFIPGLLGIANNERIPFAELWMGAHLNGPATANVAGRDVPLDRLIAEAPDKILGSATSTHFGGRLPYLFKVLDVAKMLSIQAHPTKKQAEEGFARESAEGIDLQDAERNYKDDNDKPEVAVALTDFWMLHGFRPLEQIAEMFRTVPELHSIMPDFPEKLGHTENTVQAHRALLQDLYRAVMTTPQDCIDLLLNTLITRLARTDTSDENDPGHWVVRASQTFCPVGGHCDRGILSIYLLNLVHLGAGQGTFQPAGTLHAYLEGVTVELMANSDNVLRGGLTSKHVDVPGLMRILCFDSDLPLVMNGVLNAVRAGAWERIYQTPSAEFELSSIDLESGTQYLGNAVQGPDTIIVLSGNATLAANGHCTVLSRGTIIFAPFGAHYVLHATGDRAILFKASVPSRAG